MTDLPEHVERVLARVVCGDLAADAPEVRELAARHPELLREVERLRLVQSAVDDAMSDADDVVQQARRGATDDDRRAVRAALPKPRRRRWLPMLVAALLAVAASFWLWPDDGRRPTGMLSADGLARVEAVDRGGVLVTFDDEPPKGSRYHLRLLAESGSLGREFEIYTEEQTWKFPPDWIDVMRRARGPQLLVSIVDSASTPSVSASFDLSQLLR